MTLTGHQHPAWLAQSNFTLPLTGPWRSRFDPRNLHKEHCTGHFVRVGDDAVEMIGVVVETGDEVDYMGETRMMGLLGPAMVRSIEALAAQVDKAVR